jgi:SAM-dependent methyltransferase
MGDTDTERGLTARSHDTAFAFGELDEALWDPAARATVLRSHPVFDERVLDACSGDGASALPTAELVGPGGLVDAVEQSEALVDLAREEAGERMPQLRLHVGDPTTWPYTGYDLVQCVLGISLFDDVEAGTRHLVECVRPGGRAAFTVWARGALDPLPELLAEGRSSGDAPAPAGTAVASLAIAEAETAGTFAHWLAGLGLVGVRAEAVTRHLDLTPELAWALVVGTGLRSLLGDLDEAALDGVRVRYLAAIEERDVSTVDITTLIAVGRRPE